MSKERAQRGDPSVAGVWQHRFHGPLAAGHLPAVNGRTSPGMDAAPAQDALKRLSESAAGVAGGSKPKLFRASALVASRDSERGRWPALHDSPHGLFQQTILILLRCVGAEQQNVRNVTPSEFLAQKLVDVVVCDFAGFVRAVEQVDDALLLRRQCGERAFEIIRPARRRAQQALGQRIVAIDPREEPCADRASHGAAEHRIDHRVEDDVVDRGDSGEESGVSQNYMVELVQDEQEKIPVIPAVFVQEPLVEQQPGSRAAFHAGGFRLIAELDIEQPEELLHLVARGGQYIEDVFPDGRCLRCGWTIEEDIHGKRALMSGSSKAIGAESSLSQLRSGSRRER